MQLPGRGSPAFPETPAWSPLHASRLIQQLVIVATVGRPGRTDWRTITQPNDGDGFIVTRSIIRPMIITGSINFRLQSGCPPALSASTRNDFTVTSVFLEVHSHSLGQRLTDRQICLISPLEEKKRDKNAIDFTHSPLLPRPEPEVRRINRTSWCGVTDPKITTRQKGKSFDILYLSTAASNPHVSNC